MFRRAPTGSSFGNDVTLADFNGDGKLDLAVVYVMEGAGTGRVGVYLGDGHGGFTAVPGSPFAVGNNPWSIVTGDFNRDGKLDMAVCNDGAAKQQPDSISVLLGDVHGGFTAVPGSPIPLPPNTGPLALKAADFNGDGNWTWSAQTCITKPSARFLEMATARSCWLLAVPSPCPSSHGRGTEHDQHDG